MQQDGFPHNVAIWMGLAFAAVLSLLTAFAFGGFPQPLCLMVVEPYLRLREVPAIAAKLLTKDAARRIAVNISKLPELIRQQRAQ